jgi:hypothetical protein
MIISNKMRWAGHVARMWEIRNANKIWLENTGRESSEDLGIDRRIIFKWILGKQGWSV